MTGKVKLSIIGLQKDPDGVNEPMETKQTVEADAYEKNGKQYFTWTETDAEGKNETGCRLKIAEAEMSLHKNGPIPSKMTFHAGQSIDTYYVTPYGQFPMEVDTKALSIETKERHMEVQASYTLTTSGTPLSVNELRLTAECL